MAVESAADLAVFFATGDFGVAASYRPQLGDAVTINGIVDKAHVDVAGPGEARATAMAPAFMCRTSDLAALTAGDARQDDEIVISGTAWRVFAVEPDGTGVTTLILEQV